MALLDISIPEGMATAADRLFNGQRPPAKRPAHLKEAAPSLSADVCGCCTPLSFWGKWIIRWKHYRIRLHTLTQQTESTNFSPAMPLNCAGNFLEHASACTRSLTASLNRAKAWMPYAPDLRITERCRKLMSDLDKQFWPKSSLA